MNSIKISIAICTYNRAFFLEKCLSSLYENFANRNDLEILVVDNNSNDNTKDIVNSYRKKYSNLKYFFEEKPGLSIARNNATDNAKGEYLAFIDDDVKISETYINRLFWLVNNYKFSCAGGMYYPWYLTEKPRWILKEFGQKEKILDSIGEIKSDYISGGNMIFPTQILKSIGGFPIDLGMKGEEIRYGEEDFVQNKIRENNGIIIFDPKLIVYHAVQEYKFSLWWRIKSNYINSQSNFIIHYENSGFLIMLFRLLRSIIASIFKRFPFYTSKLIFNKDYYIQNLVLDTISPVVSNFGKLMSYFKIKKGTSKQDIILPVKRTDKSTNPFKVTIAICTYNRSDFVEKCLDSLFKNKASEKPIEIIVVDNNSTDNTKNLVLRYKTKYNNIQYILEKNVGLSYARNAAIKHAKSDNIAYLDDDVKVSNTYLDRLLWVIDNYQFDCFGGMYYPWYLNEKPKWIPENYGEKEKFTDSISIINKEYITGLNMVYTKEILNKVGGFPVELGMIGNDIGYGEEDYVQNEIRKIGGTIVFDPELYVYHAVLEFKQSLIWQLKSIYINSKTNFIIHGKDQSIFYLIILLIKSSLGALLKRIPIGIFKLIFNNNYYYQNFIIEILKPILTIMGRIVVTFTNKM